MGFMLCCDAAKEGRGSEETLSESDVSLEASLDSSLDSTFSFWWWCVELFALSLLLEARDGEE